MKMSRRTPKDRADEFIKRFPGILASVKEAGNKIAENVGQPTGQPPLATTPVERPKAPGLKEVMRPDVKTEGDVFKMIDKRNSLSRRRGF